MELLTATEVCQRLKLESPAGAKRLMNRWGIKPFDLGRGRGLGLRYDWDEIESFMQKMREPHEVTKKAPKTSGSNDFFKQSWRQSNRSLTKNEKVQ